MSDDLFDFDASDEESEVDAYEGKYGLYLEDKLMVDTLSQAVRALLKRDDLEPRVIAQLAAFLYALQRVPQITEGISMGVRLVYEFDEERSWRQIRLNDSSFTLETGGYVFTPGIGGDSYSERIFEAYAGGGREGDAFVASEFAQMFAEAVTNGEHDLEIDDDHGCAFDQWDQECQDTPWSGLASDY
jgi:hypothetical protein